MKKLDLTVKAEGLKLPRIRGEGWRNGAPTPKQQDYLVIHGLSPDYGSDCDWPITAGEAGQMIYDHWLEVQAKKGKT